MIDFKFTTFIGTEVIKVNGGFNNLSDIEPNKFQEIMVSAEILDEGFKKYCNIVSFPDEPERSDELQFDLEGEIISFKLYDIVDTRRDAESFFVDLNKALSFITSVYDLEPQIQPESLYDVSIPLHEKRLPYSG